MLEAAAVRPKNVGRQAINVLDALWRGGDDEEGAAGNDGVRGERVIHVGAHNLVAADVLKPRSGIVNFQNSTLLPSVRGAGFHMISEKIIPVLRLEAPAVHAD